MLASKRWFCSLTVFIYSMPGYKCSIKERMLYSSCKSPLVDFIERQLGIPLAKKVMLVVWFCVRVCMHSQCLWVCVRAPVRACVCACVVSVVVFLFCFLFICCCWVCCVLFCLGGGGGGCLNSSCQWGVGGVVLCMIPCLYFHVIAYAPVGEIINKRIHYYYDLPPLFFSLTSCLYLSRFSLTLSCLQHLAQSAKQTHTHTHIQREREK